MLRLWIALLVGLCVCSPAWGAADERLPLPAELEPNFRFWLRIYTEVDGQGGLIHDSENMGVVYEVVRFPQGLGHRSRERHTEKIKKRYRSILLRLSKGKRSGLSEEEARVLARWPEGVSNKTLTKAANRVRFQTGQADRFREGVARSGKWRGHVEERLAAHGVLPELAALPHVESSYNPSAYSRVGAAGLWQFTRSTGRLYLRVDHVVDERMDPWAATDGAARLLRDNYRRLGTWPLAITAYNHGPAGMARAVKTVGTDDIGVISRKYKGRTFGFASRNFYSEFLAALEVDRNRERYFGYVQPDAPIRYEILETDAFYSATTLGRVLKIRPEVLREHNLALRPSVWSGAKLVPKGYGLRVPASAVTAPVDVAMASVPDSERMARQHRDRFHKVRRGESLSVIARRYHTTMSELVALNNLRSRHRIRAGQVMRLPDDGMPRTVVGRRTFPSDGIYRVERGDNLWVISQRFGVSQKDLVRWNSLTNRNRLSVGQALRVEQAPASAPKVIAAASSTATDAALTAPSRASEAEAPTVVVASRADAPAATAEPAPTPKPPVVQVSPSVAEVSPSVAEVSPSVAEVSPSVAEVSPPVAEVSPPVAEVSPPVAEVSPPVADVRPPVTVAALPNAAEIAPRELAPAPEAIAISTDTPMQSLTVAAALPPEPGAPEAAAGTPVPDPSDYAVHPDKRVTVQAEETLGHYADWLEVPTNSLRKVNGMRYGTPLAIGRQKKLDFSRVSPKLFEQRRLAYHRDLQEEFFDAWVVAGTTTHSLARGQSLWYLAQEKYEVPVWLLRQYNPDFDFGDLHAGTQMVIPLIEPRAH